MLDEDDVELDKLEIDVAELRELELLEDVELVELSWGMNANQLKLKSLTSASTRTI